LEQLKNHLKLRHSKNKKNNAKDAKDAKDAKERTPRKRFCAQKNFA